MPTSYERDMRAMRRRVRLLRAALLAVGFFGSLFIWWLTHP